MGPMWHTIKRKRKGMTATIALPVWQRRESTDSDLLRAFPVLVIAQSINSKKPKLFLRNISGKLAGFHCNTCSDGTLSTHYTLYR